MAENFSLERGEEGQEWRVPLEMGASKVKQYFTLMLIMVCGGMHSGYLLHNTWGVGGFWKHSKKWGIGFFLKLGGQN